MKLDKLDRTAVRLLIQELDKVVKDVATKYGLAVRIQRSTFDDLVVTYKTQLQIVGTNGVAAGDEAEFKRYADMLGTKPEYFGKKFVFQGHYYTICGLKPNSTRLPVLAQREDNERVYKFDTHTINRLIGDSK